MTQKLVVTSGIFATSKMPAKNITLYAQYSANSYTATFDVDGKTTTQAVDYQGLLKEPKTPTKAGYTFKGWYDEKQMVKMGFCDR